MAACPVCGSTVVTQLRCEACPHNALQEEVIRSGAKGMLESTARLSFAVEKHSPPAFGDLLETEYIAYRVMCEERQQYEDEKRARDGDG